jgi:hypothetical protein
MLGLFYKSSKVFFDGLGLRVLELGFRILVVTFKLVVQGFKIGRCCVIVEGFFFMVYGLRFSS